jgi:hypothetical protein
MRRWSTALVVGAVVMLAVLAVADAVRDDGEVQTSLAGATTTRTKPPTLREELHREALTGLITYSDEQCQLHSLLLPRLEDNVVREEGTGAPVQRCRFGVGGGRFLEDDEVISPDRTLIARCRAGHLEVLDALTGNVRSRLRGCVPTWRPDGALTYVRDGRVLAGGRLLLSRTDLRRAANRHPNVRGVVPDYPVSIHVAALAWFDERRLAATLRIRILGVETQHLLVVFQGHRATASSVRFSGPFGALVTSPAGSYVADEGGTIMARNGVATDVAEGLPRGRAVAFSPDDRWILLVTRGSIYLVATPANEAAIRTLRLPVAAGDATWEPGGPTIDTTTTAR